MRPVDPRTIHRCLRRLGGLGPYFTLQQATGPPRHGGWHPVLDLYRPDIPDNTASAALAGLVEEAGKRLGTPDRRVAASILYQGYAARIWSTTLGALLLDGILPDLAPAGLWFRTTPDALLELLVVDPAGHRAGPTTGADLDRVEHAVRTTHLDPLARAIRARTGLSGQVLAGNTASALVGSLLVLSTRPDLAGSAHRLGAALLARPGLRAAGTLDPPLSYRRASCCLYYRVPGGGLCGDCVLQHRPRQAEDQ